jgi:hypothetical protein
MGALLHAMPVAARNFFHPIVLLKHKLAVPVADALENDVRVAGNKTEQAQRRLSDLRCTNLLERDSCKFSGQYAPVMIQKDGKRLVVPIALSVPPTPLGRGR